MKVGKDYGIRNCGYLALRHLRIEKLFAYWGTDMDPHTTPIETGREFRVELQVLSFVIDFIMFCNMVFKINQTAYFSCLMRNL